MVAEPAISTEPLQIRVQDVAARHGDPPWYEQLFFDGRNTAGLICDKPGGSNDAHVHTDFNEWWIVMQGELIWEIANYPPIHAKKGDVVMSPAGTRHLIRTVGSEPSLRLAVSKLGSNHDIKGERNGQLDPLPDQRVPPNLLHTRLDDVVAHFGEPTWVESLIKDDHNTANLVYDGPGRSNTAHWHPAFDEWWTILKGELTWEIGQNRPLMHVKEGDIVFVPKGMRHYISTVGAGTSFRLAVTTPEALHIFGDDDESAPPPRA